MPNEVKRLKVDFPELALVVCALYLNWESGRERAINGLGSRILVFFIVELVLDLSDAGVLAAADLNGSRSTATVVLDIVIAHHTA